MIPQKAINARTPTLRPIQAPVPRPVPSLSPSAPVLSSGILIGSSTI